MQREVSPLRVGICDFKTVLVDRDEKGKFIVTRKSFVERKQDRVFKIGFCRIIKVCIMLKTHFLGRKLFLLV